MAVRITLVSIGARCTIHYVAANRLIDCSYGSLDSSTLNYNSVFNFLGEEQLDAPDSPMEDGARTDPDILDGDDGADTAAGPSGTTGQQENRFATPICKALFGGNIQPPSKPGNIVLQAAPPAVPPVAAVTAPPCRQFITQLKN
jgi:hypothetical protein